jgi:hypothetical protein
VKNQDIVSQKIMPTTYTELNVGLPPEMELDTHRFVNPGARN